MIVFGFDTEGNQGVIAIIGTLITLFTALYLNRRTNKRVERLEQLPPHRVCERCGGEGIAEFDFCIPGEILKTSPLKGLKNPHKLVIWFKCRICGYRWPYKKTLERL